MAEDIQAIKSSQLELWNTGNAEVVQRLYGDKVKRWDPNRPEAIRGPQEIGRYVAEVRLGFPDFKLEINEMISEGDRLAVHWTVTGTHKGEFLGIAATGKRVNLSGVTFNRIEDHKIIEEHAYFDRLTMLEQLGVAPESVRGQGKGATG
jgi:steroid delta-isomerase-like uncharacterized protein